MFATLLALGLTLSAVHCDEFTAEVRLHSSLKQTYMMNNCDLLMAQSPGPWNNGSFRNCHARSSIKIEGGSITAYTITVNTKNFKNFPTNATIDKQFSFINKKLNLNAQSCATVTGPNWEMTLRSFPTSYPMEIHLYTTAPDQDVNCTTVISNIRKTSPLLRPIDCKHQATQSEIAQSYHHRFEVNMQMPDTNDHPATEVVLLQLLWIQGALEFEQSNCTQRGFPLYDPESEVWDFVIWIHENRTSTINCNTRQKKHITAKEYEKYGAHICEEIQNVTTANSANNQRTFRMRQKGLIYLSDIPWYINEHNKFVHYLNTGHSKCKFNGYVHLNEIEINRVIRG